jgi:O-Antigen ligase
MKTAEQTLGRVVIYGVPLSLLVVLLVLLRQFEVFDVLGVKAIIILVAGIVFLALLAGGEQSRRNLLYLGFATIAAGHRGVYVGHSSYFIALEVILWTLFVVIISKRLLGQEKERFGVPFLLGFVVLWAIAVAIGNLSVSGDWDGILSWTSPLIVGLPAFVVVRAVITSREHLEKVLVIMMGASLLMSILAVVEYYFPTVETSLPWLFTSQAFTTGEGFRRAAFSFFGYPAAATFVAWGMLISYDEFFHTSDRVRQMLAAAVFLVGGWAVYISGQRSSWLGLGAALLVLNIPFGLRGVVGVTAIWGIATQFSAIFWTRVQKVTDYVGKGVVRDSSTQQRIDRASWAWDTIQNQPLIGGGFGHWLAHNVFLEIGSTIGLIPALAFAAFVVQLVFRLISMAFAGTSVDDRRCGWLFLSLSVIWIVEMSVETIFQTPPFAAAHWAMMAVAWNLPRICNRTVAITEPSEGRSRFRVGLTNDYGTSPNVQL